MRKIFQRYWWQGIILTIMLVLGLLHAIDNEYLGAHALCPFGGLMSLYSIISEGTFIHRVHGSALFLFFAVILTAIIAGRFFCGWFCPLGSVSEWIKSGAKKMGIKTMVVPPNIDKYFVYVKYVTLAVILIFTWRIGELFYREFCPWSAFMTIFEPDEIIEDVLFGGIILLIILILSIFIERLFCRYLCPLGALLSIFNKISLLKPMVNGNCKGCGLCNRACPSNIKLSEMAKINSGECISCYRCIEICPHGMISFNLKSLKPHMAGFLTITVFVVTVVGSIHLGFWERGRLFNPTIDQNSQVPERLEIPEEYQDITATTSLEEISKTNSIPLEQLYNLLDLAEDTPADTNLRAIMQEKELTRREIVQELDQHLQQPDN